jgi:ABC-type multidrug transport system fused ATPase/permease subunit
MTNVANEAVGNIRTVKAFAAEDKEHKRFMFAIEKLTTTKIRLLWISNLLSTLSGLFANAGTIMIVYIGWSQFD